MSENVNQAYVYTANGGPEVEEFAELPLPTPGPGQVRVAVRAAGVNPVDWKRRKGFGTPAVGVTVFGGEVSGIVDALGDGVSDFSVGQEVFGQPDTGGYAQYALLPLELTAAKPPSVSFADAATLPIAAATAYDGIHELDLPPGSTVLITGAGGGVGVAAVQIAKAAGLNVVGTASAGKKDLLESLGARHVEYGFDTAARIREVAPGGIDAIYDLVGGTALEEVADLLADRSKLITAADRVTVARLGGTPVTRKRDRAVLEAVAALVVEGTLDPKVTETFPLAQAPQALRLVEAGHALGKVVLEVGV